MVRVPGASLAVRATRRAPPIGGRAAAASEVTQGTTVKKTVVLCAYNVANFPEGGGHFWVYMQYALGLRRNGCDVYWLERFRRGADPRRDADTIAEFFSRLEALGFGGKGILLASRNPAVASDEGEVLGMTCPQANAVFARADLLLNFHYAIDPEMLGRFRRSALVDIDPGLFQLWVSRGQLVVPRHDHYFTTGETVGCPDARFPDCGIAWVHIRPPVCLDQWDRVHANGDAEAMTTVSSWDSSDWVVEDEVQYENTKRVAFLPFQELPHLTRQPLELALFLRTDADQKDRRTMERHGWRIRDSRIVAGTPTSYRDYIRGSRGEFACSKPSCIKLQNAWVSDRTLCYLASGKPAVVQDTGPSRYLPNGEGLFRFTSLEEAAAALTALNADYHCHSRAARALVEAHFDARQVAKRILEVAAS
jgi:hypothetical protein